MLFRSMFENILLVDQDNRIIASATQYDFSGEYALFHEDEYVKGMVVLSRAIEGFPMTLYGLYDSNRIASEFRRSLSQTWIIALICLLIALGFVLIFASNITKRLNLLVKQSREIAKGNFIQMYIEEGGTDEISILETSINQMSEQLQTYIEKEYKDEIERVKLEQIGRAHV